jgi:hypothetical protein
MRRCIVDTGCEGERFVGRLKPVPFNHIIEGETDAIQNYGAILHGFDDDDFVGDGRRTAKDGYAGDDVKVRETGHPRRTAQAAGEHGGKVGYEDEILDGTE